MAADNNLPEEVKIKDVKRLNSSLSLKRNRPQLEEVLKELQKVVRNEELQSGLVVRIPLDSDRNIHELTVSHYTRDGVPIEEQDDNFYWSDYAAILLDLAQKFRNSASREAFKAYATTEKQLESWVSASNTPVDVVDELTTWTKRHEIAELANKLALAFAKSDEPEPEKVEDEIIEEVETQEAAEDIKIKLRKELSESNTPNTSDGDAEDDEDASETLLKKDQVIDPKRPLNEQLSQEQLKQYGISVGWMTSFTMLQIADSMGVEMSDLDPALRAQLTDYATQYLGKEGDLAALLSGSPTARLKAIRGLSRLLREKNFYEKNNVPQFNEVRSSQEIFEKKLHSIINDKNPVVDKNVEKIVESIAITHGDKAIGLISSFDKQKIELIFGLSAYDLTPDQVEALKGTLVSFVEIRVSELTLHTQEEKTKDGLIGDADLGSAESVELINSVRNTITSHASSGDEKGELTADAISTTSDKTGKKIQRALEQNEKIFGLTWRSLKPEEQAVAMALLGAYYPTPDGKHPPEGYPMPINIAELDPKFLKKYTQIIIDEQTVAEEAQLEQLAIAQEMNEYVVTVQRAETLSLHIRNEFVIQIDEKVLDQMHEQVPLDQQSLQEMVVSQQQISSGGDSNKKTGSGSDNVAAATGTASKLSGAFKAAAGNPASSKIKTEAAKKIAEKLAMGTGVGTAVVAGARALELLIGKENTKKLALALTGLTAGAVGALIYKTIQALQTVGGMIGGVAGGIIGGVLGVGSPLAIFLGVSAGANAGLAAQNWFMNLIGKGPATGTASAGLSAPSFGANSVFGSGTSATTPLQIAKGTQAAANGVIQGTGNAVQAVTNIGQQAVAGSTATATAPAAATVSGLQAAAAATGSFLTSLPAIAVGTSVILPGFMTLIVFMVIMGAFLVPMPFTISKGTPTVSKYATIVKTPTPDEIDNNEEKDISYEIKILPKPGYALQIKRVTDEFLVLGGEATVPDSPLTIDNFDQEKFSTVQTAEYTLPISGEDALVINTVTFVVDVYDGSGKLLIQGESISALGMLIIGDPPIGCFEFAPADQPTEYKNDAGQTIVNTSVEWTKDDIIKFLRAFISKVGTNPKYLSLLCEKGDISLHKWPPSPQGYYGWRVNTEKIGFYGDFFNSSVEWMEYTIVHETGHMINARNQPAVPSMPDLQTQFKAIQTSPLPGDSGCFTYPVPGNCSEGEAFAEAVVDYVVWQTLSFSNDGWTGMFPFKSRYPVEYAWIQENIFGGIEY